MRLQRSKKEKELPAQTKKQRRELHVLLGLVDLYVVSGKPIGSETLREAGFQELSSATIRNYFVHLEEQGYLRQAHASGGRIPTNAAFRLYAQECLAQPVHSPDKEHPFASLAMTESRNVNRYLQQAAEHLSRVSGYAVFLSSPRFDHDMLLEVKLLGIDSSRVLCVLVTDFGQIFTEILPTQEGAFDAETLARIQSYIQWKIKEGALPERLTQEEEEWALRVYNEILLRYLIRYSNFTDAEIFRTGFSQLLAYAELQDPLALTTGLSLFENTHQMRLLLQECLRKDQLTYWIGKDLAPYASAAQGCTVLAIPYAIGHTRVGSIGLLGPCRMPYRHLFGMLQLFAAALTQSLTRSLYKFKLSFRQPQAKGTPYIQAEERIFLTQTQKLIETQHDNT